MDGIKSKIPFKITPPLQILGKYQISSNYCGLLRIDELWNKFTFILDIFILGDNLGHLKEEVQELQTTLKEEQFYSTELKKEVERLSTAVHKSTEEQTVETSEIDLYETQIKALSEAKDLRKCRKNIFISIFTIWR